MTLWRPPRTMSERTARAVRSMQNGSMDGQIVSAQPVRHTYTYTENEDYQLDDVIDEGNEDRSVINQDLIPWTDQFKLTIPGGIIFELTHIPYQHQQILSVEKGHEVSLHAYWNGVFQEDESYTLYYDDIQDISIVSFSDPDRRVKPGDVFTFKYWYKPTERKKRPLIGTFVKQHKKGGSYLPFYGDGYLGTVGKGTPGDILSYPAFTTQQYGCQSPGPHGATMGVVNRSKEDIPMDDELYHWWFFNWDAEVTASIYGKKFAGNSREYYATTPCQYPDGSKPRCGVGTPSTGVYISREEYERIPEETNWVNGIQARPSPGRYLTLSGDAAKNFSRDVNRDRAMGASVGLNPRPWGKSGGCVCPAFGGQICFDGTIWGKHGVASIGFPIYLGATLIITREEFPAFMNQVDRAWTP